MKKLVGSALKIGIPLLLGVFLVYWFYQGLSENDKTEIFAAMGQTNYFWIGVSLFMATLSHVSRAWRWKYTLAPLGYKLRLWNGFFAVMVGYLVNLAVPRLGEISRVGTIVRYEKIALEKGFGTIVAERLVDLVILLMLTVFVAVVEFEVIRDLLLELSEKTLGAVPGPLAIGALLILAAIGIGGLVWLFRSKTELKWVMAIRQKVAGLFDGMKSIFTMDKKWEFIGHTIFIWGMYIAMFFVCFLALPATQAVPFGGVMSAFVLGSFAIVLTNGGIGAYPLALMGILQIYGVDENVAGAFGWVVWSAQTILILFLGVLSFIMLPIYNRGSEEIEN